MSEEKVCNTCIKWFNEKVCDKLPDPELCKKIVKEFEEGKISVEELVKKIEEAFKKEDLDKALMDASNESTST